MTRNKQKTLKLVRLGLLVAIEILFAFTPLGYLRVGVVEITFMTIPVAIGAITCGVGAGVILGTIFGVSSFLQCFGISAFGTLLFDVNPVGTVILCILPRVLVGLSCGWIYKALSAKKVNNLLSVTVTSLSAALLNTILFVLFFALFFHSAVLDFGGGAVMDLTAMNILDILVALAGVNGLIEAGVCTLLASSIGKALVHFLPDLKKE